MTSFLKRIYFRLWFVLLLIVIYSNIFSYACMFYKGSSKIPHLKTLLRLCICLWNGQAFPIGKSANY